MLAADRLKQVCEELLDEEDGDEVIITQVTSSTKDLEPTETLELFRRARNALIRTRIKECYQQAQEFDKMIHILSFRGMEDGFMPTYDYSKFLDIAEAVIVKDEDPL
ncbi:MAG: hypothetical protein ACRDZY_17690 [Acidimicrobiales bacterium]